MTYERKTKQKYYENFKNLDNVRIGDIADQTLKNLFEDKEMIELMLETTSDIDKKEMLKRMKENNLKNIDNMLKVKSETFLLSDYITLNTWGLSENYAFHAVINNYGQAKMVKTNIYTKWEQRLRATLNNNDRLKNFNINPNIPVIMSLEFEHEARFDVQNLAKSFLDVLFDEMGIDDNCVVMVNIKTRRIVSEPSMSRIHFAIKNV